MKIGDRYVSSRKRIAKITGVNDSYVEYTYDDTRHETRYKTHRKPNTTTLEREEFLAKFKKLET